MFEDLALDFSRNRVDGDDILGDASEFLMRYFATESGKLRGSSTRYPKSVGSWHTREETFRVELACLSDAIHAEPTAAWFGQGHRTSANG